MTAFAAVRHGAPVVAAHPFGAGTNPAFVSAMARHAPRLGLALILLAACASKDAAPSAGSSSAAASTGSGAAKAATLAVPPRPSFAKRRALTAQGKAAAASGDWDSCGRLFEAAHAWTDAARCIVHTRDTGRALDDLQRALAHGTHDLDKLAADPELAPLQRDPRWRPLLSGAAARQASEHDRRNAELAQLVRPDPQGTEVYVYSSRRGRVADIIASGGDLVAEDYVHAATVYYRADTANDAARAHELALIAAERDPDSDEARWLAAASEDRRLKHEGKPQRYGTQFVISNGKRVLWNIDPAVSDAERERWSVPSLAEAIAGDAETSASARLDTTTTAM